jgi:hypothetical protein
MLLVGSSVDQIIAVFKTMFFIPGFEFMRNTSLRHPPPNSHTNIQPWIMLPTRTAGQDLGGEILTEYTT